MWQDRLDDIIGNDLLYSNEGNHKSLERFPTKTNLANFLTFVLYGETTNLN